MTLKQFLASPQNRQFDELCITDIYGNEIVDTEFVKNDRKYHAEVLDVKTGANIAAAEVMIDWFDGNPGCFERSKQEWSWKVIDGLKGNSDVTPIYSLDDNGNVIDHVFMRTRLTWWDLTGLLFRICKCRLEVTKDVVNGEPGFWLGILTDRGFWKKGEML